VANQFVHSYGVLAVERLCIEGLSSCHAHQLIVLRACVLDSATSSALSRRGRSHIWQHGLACTNSGQLLLGDAADRPSWSSTPHAQRVRPTGRGADRRLGIAQDHGPRPFRRPTWLRSKTA
jgi:hypothetical protein